MSELGKITFEYLHTAHGVHTQCEVEVDGEHLVGYARLSPHDNHNRKIGRKVALTRALEVLPRKQRAEIWQQVWARGIKRA